jgi:hypothetical protein
MICNPDRNPLSSREPVVSRQINRDGPMGSVLLAQDRLLTLPVDRVRVREGIVIKMIAGPIISLAD